MRWMLLSFLIAMLVVGCSTKTTTIKTHPSDDASATIKSGTVIAADNHLEQGKHLYYKGKYRQAIKHLIRSISGNPNNWETHYYLGLCQQKTGRYDRSIGSFNNSLKYCTAGNRILGNIYFAFGVSWEQEGYLHKAGETYKLARRFNPTLAEAESALKRVEAKVSKAEKKKKKNGAKAF